MKILFSDVFEVDPAAVEAHGAFNVALVADLPLFIDPFLIFNSPDPTYQELHERIVQIPALSAPEGADRRSVGRPDQSLVPLPGDQRELARLLGHG